MLLSRGVDRLTVVHVQGVGLSFPACLAAKALGRRCITSVHYQLTTNPSLESRLAGLFLNIPDSVLTLSEISRAGLLRIGIRKPIETFRYWINGDSFKPKDYTEARKDFGFPNRFVVLFVGRLVEEKGVLLLLQVASTLKQDRDFVFLIVGTGPLEPIVEAAQKETENLRFLGRVENQDLAPIYSSADVLIVPSVHEEGFGRVILESLSCGTPVIASKVGGIPEAMNDTVGFLVEPEVTRFVEALIRLKGRSEARKDLRASCARYASEHFDSKNAETIIREYVP